jgi:hypothetical protein
MKYKNGKKYRAKHSRTLSGREATHCSRIGLRIFCRGKGEYIENPGLLGQFWVLCPVQGFGLPARVAILGNPSLQINYRGRDAGCMLGGELSGKTFLRT